MITSTRRALSSCLFTSLLLLVSGAAGAQVRLKPDTPTVTLTPQALASVWDAEYVSPPLPPLVDHAEVTRRLADVAASAPDLFRVEKIGESLEGRSINHVTAGTGPFGVLLWSQMHGDEPTATSALFDLFEFLHRHRGEPPVARILSRLTLHVVPMLNPDGAERFQRRNLQSIDINRDALRLQTAEGQPPFIADVGIVANRRVRVVDGRRELQVATTIDDLGDLRTLGGLRTIDATGMTLVPLGPPRLEPGQIVDLPEWRTKSDAIIAVGQPARIALLKPSGNGKFVVELVLQ